MGTTGTGRFTDYPAGKKDNVGGGGGGGTTGGSSPVNQCEVALRDVRLEEVERCDYFSAHGSVPPVGTPVRVRKALVGKRMGAETFAGEVVGVFPTKFNYLRTCIEQGYKYEGKVFSSQSGKLPAVVVELAHSR